MCMITYNFKMAFSKLPNLSNFNDFLNQLHSFHDERLE